MTPPVTRSDPAPMDAPELGPGAVVGRYVLRRRIGEGGMGVVWAAHDPELDRLVAVKVIAVRSDGSAPNDQARARLLREARAMARLSHPNVVPVYDVGDQDGQVFLAMELVDGVTLRAWQQQKPRSLREILAAYRSAGEGLSAAHEAGLVHRDFKPDNVLVGHDGRVRVLDFGLARSVKARPNAPAPPALATAPADLALAATMNVGADATGAAGPPPVRLAPAPDPQAPEAVVAEAITRTGAMLGTPLYMAPEQILGEPADARTDQYSFCAALYEAVYGTPPVRADNVIALLAKVSLGALDPPPPGARVPARLRRALLRGLSRKPEERFPSMRALLLALAPPARPSRLALLLGLAAALGVALLLVLRARSPVEPPARTTVAARAPTQRRLTFAGLVSMPVVAPGGDLLAYLLGDAVMVRDLARGTERRLPALPRVYGMDFQPGGRALEIWGEGDREEPRHTVVSLADGAVTALPPGNKVLYAPDGALAVTWRSSERSLRILRVATGEAREIPIRAPFLFLPDVAWSRDARWLALHVDRGSRHALLTVRVDGGEEHEVLDGPEPMGKPAWSPRGDALYVLHGSESMDLIKIPLHPGSATAAGPPAVLVPALGSGEEIALLPGGKSLVYVRTEQQVNVYSVRSAARGEAALRPLSSGGPPKANGLAVAPDGQSIAYVERTGSIQLAVRPLGGGAPTTVCEVDVLSTVAFSPDGKQIALVLGSGEEARIARLDLATCARQVIGKSPADPTMTLSWGPSTRIVYSPPSHDTLIELDPETGLENELFPRDQGWFFMPHPSPDGAALAFFWNRRGHGPQLVVLDRTSGSSRSLLPEHWVPAGWSEDGRWIYAYEWDLRPVAHRLLRLPAAGGPPEELLQLPADRGPFAIERVPRTEDFAAMLMHRSADLWMLEDFDPASND